MQDVADDRFPTMDTATEVWSQPGRPLILLALCTLAAVVIRWRSGKWRVAVIPTVAVALQAVAVLAAVLLVRRSGPVVTALDPAVATSSYPSSPAAATMALCISVALVATTQVHHPRIRAVVITVALAIPALVAYAGVYRGTHRLSDVTAGALVGLGAAALAWQWLRPAEDVREIG